jgi:hypothetical protein
MKGKNRLASLLVLAIVMAVAASGISAAPPEGIQTAIDAGLAWLTSDQVQSDENGSWSNQVPYTCLVLVKLQERAYELGHSSPFDPAYPYSQNVVRAWEYVFGASDGVPKTDLEEIGTQQHNGRPDNPDTNGNGFGIRFPGPGIDTYNTGICAMALAASGTPDRSNDGGLDHDGDGNVDTFGEIAQDAVDWLAFAQADVGGAEGGWTYEAQDNKGEAADQSNSGYAVLGLAYGEEFGCTVPDWVKMELEVWIDHIQCLDGGSGYQECPVSNLLRTGNLVFEMCFVGYDPQLPRFQHALGFIESSWRNDSEDPGWGYNLDPANYQTMYCLMKGLEYCNILLLDTDGDGQPDDDWFNQQPPATPAQDFASVLVAQQETKGYWPESMWGEEVLSTAWALLTLERSAPPVPFIQVPVDILPGTCPNDLEAQSGEEVSVAVLGTAELGVTDIDPATIRLTREGYGAGISPLSWDYEDVATPFSGELCDCHDLGGDGLTDLVLIFETHEVKAMLDAGDQGSGPVPLLVNGNLKEAADEVPIVGADCVLRPYMVYLPLVLRQ